MASNSTTLFLSFALLIIILYSAYDIRSEIQRVDSLLEAKTANKANFKSPYEDQEKSCNSYQEKTQECLKNAQDCLKVLNSYNNKNKEFEVQVKQCQSRNAKNSKRNT